MMPSRIQSWIELKEGDRPFESGKFQFLWALYLAALAAALMWAASARSGGYEGFSWYLVAVVLLYGFLIGFSAMFVEDTRLQILLAILSSVGFWAIIWIGINLFPGFSHYGENPKRPFRIAAAIYSIAVFVIFSRLQRPISASLDDGSYSTDIFQTHFNNNWRISQAILSLTAILVVGVFLPMGTLMTQRESIHLIPLTIFVGGLLSAFLVLGLQFMYEVYFLEKAYKRVNDQ